MPNEILLRGVDRVYRAKFGTNAWATLEERTGLTRDQALAALRKRRPDVGLLREFIRAGLTDPPAPTIEEAGDILDDIGGAAIVQGALPPPATKRRRA
jgi:hypothetical protein